VRPAYDLWRERQAEAVRLYRLGRDLDEIGLALGVARSTAWRYLRLAGQPISHRAKLAAPTSVLPRQPHWQLHQRGGACEIVLGRKFCSGCGRWRHLCDFPPDGRKSTAHRAYGPIPRCRTCSRICRRWYVYHETPAQRANRRERHRFYKEGERRRAGVPVSTARRPTVVDRPEFVFLDRGPLVRELRRFEGEWSEIARRSGVPPRSITRLLNDGGAYVRIDTADKLAVAMRLTLSLIYGEDYDAPTADLIECAHCWRVMPARALSVHVNNRHREVAA